ncbi:MULTISPECIES: hypothetical protein [Halobacterium]|uniref:Uncharacterized protein n=4 Tax=Halobacterium salinarum TaxID=2242 RepID=Q9HP39_HALSA|nr:MULTISPECIES: hypothetical protein [Halobacterium]AAG20031.1 hypothetical protein VNG_1820H [Halobacterium salinarum NRC-1]MBB6089041.1 hypothetical protein [Halobacterium salinarum]MCF2164738.1 hypothetical protein [Halobacterium salinarum]MCF2167583.1 hypothetical protein [Halobacterium salinarum]MCF2207068.1 hypothetical protein [Halobacterium salinarum]
MVQTHEPQEAAGTDDMSKRSQWLLVAALAVCGLAAPAFIYWAGAGSFGLGFRDTYLTIPMIPAVLLGVVGVWTAVRG